MPLDFPSNPTNGQTYQNFVYNSAITAWQQQGTPNNVGVQIAALQTASPVTVANTTARNALYPNPAQGQSVFRTDIGSVETYYGLYNASTNPGGRDAAGWYATAHTDALTPATNLTLSYTSGTCTSNAMGVFSLNGVTVLRIDGLKAFGRYRVIFKIAGATAASDIAMKFRSSSGDQSSGYYGAGYQVAYNVAMSTAAQLGGGGNMWGGGAASQGSFVYEITGFYQAATMNGVGYTANNASNYGMGYNVGLPSALTGFTLYGYSAQAFTGTVQVLEYVEA